MTSNSGRLGLHHAPMAFPRQGEVMLSFALNSQSTIEVNGRPVRPLTHCLIQVQRAVSGSHQAVG